MIDIFYSPINMDDYAELREMDLESAGEFSLDGKDAIAKVVYVYDADTCHIIFNLEGIGLTRMNCRLFGIDTPEMRPSLSKQNREEEKRRAIRARNRLVQFITRRDDIDIDKSYRKEDLNGILKDNRNLVYARFHEFDKYGRLLVELFDENDRETSYNKRLISEDFAYEYYGGTKR